jgi:hypothetical protein
MPVTLAKIIDGNVVVTDDLPNEQNVACPKCTQAYRLAYSTPNGIGSKTGRGSQRPRCGETMLRGMRRVRSR